MKKILAILLCVMLVCITPVVAFADDSTVAEDSGLVDVPDTDPIPTDEPPTTEVVKTIAEQIEEWIVARLDDIAVVVTLVLNIIYTFRKNKSLNKSLGTINNNAITIAKTSNDSVSTALAGVENAATIVSQFSNDISLLLAEVRKNAEEKEALEEVLTDVRNSLKTAKLANIEFADELAELLVLANIPNSKKDEIYSRHRAAVESLAEAENTEVKEDVGEEA